MIAVECPYCGLTNHTSCPEVMAECAYCSKAFAQVNTANQKITVLAAGVPDARQRAELLKTEWEMCGELERDVIVDRRLGDEEIEGPDRRQSLYQLRAA